MFAKAVEGSTAGLVRKLQVRHRQAQMMHGMAPVQHAHDLLAAEAQLLFDPR